MNQLGLFDSAPEMRRPEKPATAMLLAMEGDYQFGKQATPEQAQSLLERANAITASAFDMRNVPGQETAKRAIEIALAGNHRLALISKDPMPLVMAAAWQLREQCISSAHIGGTDSFDSGKPFEMRVTLDEDANPPPGYESSDQIARRVKSAQHQRLKSNIAMDSNGQIFRQQLEAAGYFDFATMQTMTEIARTIAHLAGCDYIGRIHLAEAASYCPERPAA